MSKAQDRLQTVVSLLLSNGWTYDGTTYQSKRARYRKGSALCTVGSVTFFIEDLIDPTLRLKIPMKLGVDIIINAAATYGVPSPLQSTNDFLVMAINSIANADDGADTHTMAMYTIQEHTANIKPEYADYRSSTLLESICESGIHYQYSIGSCPSHIADWFCNMPYALADECPDDLFSAIDWVISQEFWLNYEMKSNELQQVVGLWQLCEFMSHASINELRNVIAGTKKNIVSRPYATRVAA